MALKDIFVPDIGDYKDVDVIEILVSPGDKIEEETSLISLETDKATMEVPAPIKGIVKEVLVKAGDKVSEGTLIMRVETEKEAEKNLQQEQNKPALEEKADAKSEQELTPSIQEIRVPDIGDYHNVDVIEVMIKAGDEVEEETPLLTLETDKATMEIPAPLKGKITEVAVKAGDKISQGDLIALAQTESSLHSASPENIQSEAEKKPEKEIALQSASGKSDIHAAPAVRRIARSLGVDLTKVNPTGRKGRITREDVERTVKEVMQGHDKGSYGDTGLGLIPDPVVDFAKFGEIEAQPLSRINKLSAANLHRNWVKIPHVTFFEDADITDLEAFRKAKKAQAEKAGTKLTPVAFIVKAVAKALVDFPRMNASLSSDGEKLIFKKYVNIGVAVDTPNGLVVPVIKNADQKGIFTIANDLLALAKKGREGKLTGGDMQGGCFTISSLGGIGTKAFTPIVNMPEVGILGVSKSSILPVYNGKEFVPRLMLPLSLSVDHRVIDGAYAGQFIVQVAQYLSDLKELVL